MGMRTLTFGDLESGVWGVAWDLGVDQPGFALVGDRASAAAPAAALTDDWKLSGEGLEVETSAEEDGAPDDLVEVRGQVLLGGAERDIDCLGRRASPPDLDPVAFESVRDVAAWFAIDDGLAVTAARPRRSRGQQGDELTAVVFESGETLAVAEPRLSTGYDSAGRPTRAGVELWLIPPGEDDESTDEKHRYPRRAAGEATGEPATLTAGALSVEARLFRWHAHGRVGAGVYTMVRAR